MYYGASDLDPFKRRFFLSERNHLEEAGVDGKIILNWIFSTIIGGGGGRALDLYGSGWG